MGRKTEYQPEKGDKRQPCVKDETNPKWKNITPAHEKLWIWQKANKLYLEIGKLSELFPAKEKYNLTSQVTRSAKSIKDNIAEGNESYYYNDKIKGFYTARKETGETQNHIREMMDKEYIASQKGQDMIDEYEEVKRGINGIVRTTCAKRDVRKKAKE